MATTVKLKNSVTTTAAPSTLVQGEAAVNITDKKVWVGNAASSPVQILGAGATVSGTTGTFSSTLSVTDGASIQGLTVGRGAGSISSNTVLGSGALASGSQSGTDIVAVGIGVLAANTSGQYNTGVGRASLNFNTTGGSNSALGYNSLVSNTTGSSNTAIGLSSLSANTTANNQTAVGYQAGASSTGGGGLFVGTRAGYSTTTGVGNTFVGGTYNSYVGYSNTTGSNNTALGTDALQANTTASNNTAVGYQAGYSNTTGAFNTSIGHGSLYSNTTGYDNAAIGYQAGYSNTTGFNQTFIGDYAGQSTTGSKNTFLGRASGYLVTTGAANTILGAYNGNQGGLDIRTASNNIVLSDGDGNPRAYYASGGEYVQTTNVNNFYIAKFENTNNTSGNGTIWSKLGTNANNGSSYHFIASCNTADVLYIRGNGNVQNTNNSYGSISDIKVKENIVDATPKLDKLNQVRVVNYNLIGQEQKQIGVIAQELEQIFPSIVEESEDIDKEGNKLGTTTKSVKYSVFVPMLIKAIQELKAEVDSLKAQINNGV